MHHESTLKLTLQVFEELLFFFLKGGLPLELCLTLLVQRTEAQLQAESTDITQVSTD